MFPTTSFLAIAIALSSGIQAAVPPRDVTPPVVDCQPFGTADEFYYTLSAHSSPLYGVQVDPATGLLQATSTRDTGDQFLFEQCNAPSTGYIQGQPITRGLAPDYFGHVRHVASGQCLRHQDKALTFILDTCPENDVADEQLPFWFESPDAGSGGVVRYTGYKNKTAYPKPWWFAGTNGNEPPFFIQTQRDAQMATANQWVLAHPIRVSGAGA
ncbi:hypothetical protein B0H16DRAFT_1721545 [Mycena metata]|uniref:Ricin B lectin domain-containing protein n=1 Tax=Mycena metata TaxID=1033252 RepID=A0AAD7NEC2_9AGAR|nr:hypothetical protein B0H16DRAFT_1721545 [Mycena metata]